MAGPEWSCATVIKDPSVMAVRAIPRQFVLKIVFLENVTIVSRVLEQVLLLKLYDAMEMFLPSELFAPPQETVVEANVNP